MRNFIAGFIACFLVFIGLGVGAAVTTINTTAPEDARIVVAFGDYLHLGRNATQAEIKGAVADFVKGVVYNYETVQASKTAIQGTTQINPT